MEEAVKYGQEKMKYCELHPNQMKVIKGYASGEDVFFCSSTGSGKSLTFEIAPFVMSFLNDKENLPTVCFIVVSPLISLMKSQEKKMQSLGIRCLYLSEQNEGLGDIDKLHFDILFTSTETLL